MFRVGMPVVCVNDVGQMGSAPFAVEGRVYIVSGICDWPGYPLGLRFDELNMQPDEFLYATRFRPVISPKQEVSFTTGAPVDSERWDNRVKRSPQKAVTALQS